MSKTWRIIVILVVIGVAIAIVVGVAGQSQTAANQQFCNSLDSLETDIDNLLSLDASTASQSDVQSDISAIQSDWNNVVSDAQNLQGINLSSLQSAWDGFEQAVQSVGSDTSASDAQQAISQSAEQLESTVESNIDSYDC